MEPISVAAAPRTNLHREIFLPELEIREPCRRLKAEGVQFTLIGLQVQEHLLVFTASRWDRINLLIIVKEHGKYYVRL